jgi:hypothetical protein
MGWRVVMTMTPERRIAFAVFAAGVLIAIVALSGCAGGDDEPPPDGGRSQASQPEVQPECKRQVPPEQILGVALLPEEDAVRVDWADSSSVVACRIEVTPSEEDGPVTTVAVRMRIGTPGAVNDDLRQRCSYTVVDFDITSETEVLLSGDGVGEADRDPEPDSDTTQGCEQVATRPVQGYVPLLSPNLAISPCPESHSSLPVVAAELSEDGDAIRVVGPGVACGFAITEYNGTLYVELRKRSEDPTDYEQLMCYDLTLKVPVSPGLEVTPISPGQRAKVDGDSTAALLSSGDDCAEPPEQEPSFIID